MGDKAAEDNKLESALRALNSCLAWHDGDPWRNSAGMKRLKWELQRKIIVDAIERISH